MIIAHDVPLSIHYSTKLLHKNRSLFRDIVDLRYHNIDLSC